MAHRIPMLCRAGCDVRRPGKLTSAEAHRRRMADFQRLCAQASSPGHDGGRSRWMFPRTLDCRCACCGTRLCARAQLAPRPSSTLATSGRRGHALCTKSVDLRGSWAVRGRGVDIRRPPAEDRIASKPALRILFERGIYLDWMRQACRVDASRMQSNNVLLGPCMRGLDVQRVWQLGCRCLESFPPHTGCGHPSCSPARRHNETARAVQCHAASSKQKHSDAPHLLSNNYRENLARPFRSPSAPTPLHPPSRHFLTKGNTMLASTSANTSAAIRGAHQRSYAPPAAARCHGGAAVPGAVRTRLVAVASLAPRRPANRLQGAARPGSRWPLAVCVAKLLGCALRTRSCGSLALPWRSRIARSGNLRCTTGTPCTARGATNI
eukprot:364747-Chlamydomonas_euryale.AAC.9